MRLFEVSAMKNPFKVILNGGNPYQQEGLPFNKITFFLRRVYCSGENPLLFYIIFIAGCIELKFIIYNLLSNYS